MAKSELRHVVEARRKRGELFDHYAKIGTGPGRVAELLGIDIVEATRELAKRKGSRGHVAAGGSAERGVQ